MSLKALSTRASYCGQVLPQTASPTRLNSSVASGSVASEAVAAAGSAAGASTATAAVAASPWVAASATWSAGGCAWQAASSIAPDSSDARKILFMLIPRIQ
jgi:hypothetical protein